VKIEPKMAMSAAAIYSVAISSFYIYGFWSCFGINPFEYISFSDVAKIASFPLGIAFLGIILGAGVNATSNLSLIDDGIEQELSGLAAKLQDGRFLWPSIGALLLVAFLVPEPFKSALCTLLFLVPITQFAGAMTFRVDAFEPAIMLARV
jgi:hypothetical protein